MARLLMIEQVRFSYPQDGHGLEPFSLCLDAGEGVAITGPSGCGKSTLARCVSGLIPHLYRGQLGGKVLLNGVSIADQPLWQIAEQVGIVFQNPTTQMLAPSAAAALIGALGHMGKFLVKWALGVLTGAPLGFVALGLLKSLVGYIVFGALGGVLGALTILALRKAGFFVYLAEKR